MLHYFEPGGCNNIKQKTIDRADYHRAVFPNPVPEVLLVQQLISKVSKTSNECQIRVHNWGHTAYRDQEDSFSHQL